LLTRLSRTGGVPERQHERHKAKHKRDEKKRSQDEAPGIATNQGRGYCADRHGDDRRQVHRAYQQPAPEAIGHAREMSGTAKTGWSRQRIVDRESPVRTPAIVAGHQCQPRAKECYGTRTANAEPCLFVRKNWIIAWPCRYGVLQVSHGLGMSERLADVVVRAGSPSPGYFIFDMGLTTLLVGRAPQ
jgi:hypothetical protein